MLINSRCLLFTVLEAGKSEVKAPTWSHSGEGPLSGSEHLLMSSHGRRDKRSLWSLFYESTHPFMRTSPSSQNSHLLNYQPLGFRISTWISRWHNIQAIHHILPSDLAESNFPFTFQFHALEKEMATHSSVLAWRIPGTGEPGWASVYGVTESRTRLKQLSSSSSDYHDTVHL